LVLLGPNGIPVLVDNVVILVFATVPIDFVVGGCGGLGVGVVVVVEVVVVVVVADVFLPPHPVNSGFWFVVRADFTTT
jgi:hypothetical protein